MPIPEKYNINIASESNNWVNGSVEGVKIAPTIVEINIIYRHESNICFGETILSNPNKIWMTGIWKANPVL